MLKRLPRIAALFVGANLLAVPASARVSPSQAQKLCQTAVKVLQPPPKSAQLDRSEKVQTTNDLVTVFILIVTADDVPVKVNCTVDRATSMATVTPINPPGAPDLAEPR